MSNDESTLYNPSDDSDTDDGLSPNLEVASSTSETIEQMIQQQKRSIIRKVIIDNISTRE